MQQKISHYQALYREWLALQADNDKLMANLHRQNAITDELSAFYFNHHGQSDWQRYYEALENGADVDLTTDGEYSVMSQDTLWDMFCDERAFYERLSKFAQNRLHDLNNK
ncbi:MULTISPECIES: DUF4298 domain-containing protein [Moraxella]|jgi:hypothetical protein|uniref:DUF4298 domain-containing protein n=1 Tax=Moraxella lacunata TaxID=477 RepID=A0A1B8PYZ8_MORLA|nr:MULTISPECIES: DUF4298 domain-containing protein [Moraxella]MBE9579080.1 DUF4298 domain-containing protein [Moraxella sp. K1664]MBE9589172.1 DUF4298 domain-containing protein [Moraxella sp. K1630]MBE9596528.1 DUF4298 domain-containing protein [Moraxella sp. K2450]MDH9219009.1 DUF4298 domain-containing protein [Moraxella lacunata]MDI4483114.1 DUF4298 domain-containing protein [Moraxella lacunata]